ncbi:MAG: cytochrome P450, partial [Myxococcota bacterium]
MDRTTIPPVLPRVPGLPLLGNALALKPAQMPTQLEIWARVYGPIYTFRLLHRRGICVSDTDVGLWALKQRPDRFRRPKRMELVARQLETHGLFTAEGEDWHRQRTLMRPAFSRRAFEQTFGHIPVVTERLMRRWSSLGSVPIEARQELMRFTADVTTLLAFGQDLNSVEEPSALQRQIEEIFAALSRRVLAPLPYLWMLPLPQERSADRAAGHVRDRVLD